MKLFYLANVRFPSERAHSAQISHMCQAFVSKGFEVTLFSRLQVGLDEMSGELGFSPAFTVVNLPSIPPRRWRFVFYLSELIFTLAFLLRNGWRSFDFIYCRSEWTLFFLLPFVTTKKMIWESHEARWNYPARVIVRKGMRVVAISDAIKEDYVALGVPAEQIKVAYDGIDESFFEELESKHEARGRLGLEQDAFIAMYIGGLDQWKGAELFMRAAKLTPHVQHVVIGGREGEIEAVRPKYPSVNFLGSRPYSELKHNQQAADVLVIPNSGKTKLASRYTSPLKLFSYLASGVPIVGSDVPSITSVTGRKSVMLFEPDSVQSLAGAIKFCKESHIEQVESATKLKEESKKYTWTERAAEIKQFLLN